METQENLDKQKSEALNALQPGAQEFSEHHLKESEQSRLQQFHRTETQHTKPIELPSFSQKPEVAEGVPIISKDDLNDSMARGQEVIAKAERIVTGSSDASPKEMTSIAAALVDSDAEKEKSPLDLA